MFWFGIQSITNILKTTRKKIGDVIYYGYKTYADLTSSFSQESQKDKQYSENNCLSDRSLIKKSVNYKSKKRTPRLLHMTVSEYWKDALYNHWFILIQCLVLVIIIILIAPWIGSDCNDESSFEDSYFDHRPDVHLRQLRRTIDERANLLSRKPCSYMSLFSSGNDYHDRLNKRSGILRRKRVYKRFF